MTRGVRLALLAVAVVAAGGVGWWSTHRAGGGTRITVGGGHISVVLPAGWHSIDCMVSRPDCVELRPADQSEIVDVMLLRSDPNPVEGDPSLMLFDPNLPASGDIRRFTVNGFRAVATEGLSAVLLDDDGTRAIVICGFGRVETPGCRAIVDSLAVSWP